MHVKTYKMQKNTYGTISGHVAEQVFVKCHNILNEPVFVRIRHE